MIWTIATIAILIVAAAILAIQSNKTGDPQRATALSRIALVLLVVAAVLAVIVGIDLAQEYALV